MAQYKSQITCTAIVCECMWHVACLYVWRCM